MSAVDSYHKLCLQQQTELRRILTDETRHTQAIQLFLMQHSMLHSTKMTQDTPWSFEDEIFKDLTDDQARQIPPRGKHSIVWCLWHIARIEDVAMNMLISGSAQVLDREIWPERMRSPLRHTGNAMDEVEITNLSVSIDVVALRDYRLAVGKRTREIVIELSPDALRLKVDTSRLERVMQQGDLLEGARGIADYWSKRDVAGLLLMPATRHPLVHLNEALHIKNKLLKTVGSS